MAVWINDPKGTLQTPLGESAAGSSRLLISKGAPEAIVALCDRWVDGAGAASTVSVVPELNAVCWSPSTAVVVVWSAYAMTTSVADDPLVVTVSVWVVAVSVSIRSGC